MGVVTNVSAGGLFIATRQPLPPRASIELEIEEDDGRLRLSGQVVHAARFPPLYQQIFKSGMGVRYRQPEAAAAVHLAQRGVALSDRGGRRKQTRAS